MIAKIKKYLSFFRFLDENGQLSLTNMAVMIVLWKMICCIQFDLSSAAVLLTTLSAYNFKRYLGMQKKEETLVAAPSKEIMTIMDEISKIKLKLGFSNYGD